MNTGKILICDFEPNLGLSEPLRVILDSARSSGRSFECEVVDASCSSFSPEELARLLFIARPGLLFFILSYATFRVSKELFHAVRADSVPLIVAVEGGEPAQMLELFDSGAVDLVTAPFRGVELMARVWRQVETRRPAAGKSAPEESDTPEPLRRLVGRNSFFRQQLAKIPVVAQCDASVLILGETGTGKELAARAIHELSQRAKAPFEAVNCGAIPTELAESELFGHERGAFTGAVASQPGVVEAAEGGTLFLDEVGCLPLPAQAKLLRFLQEREFRPVGGSKCRRADVRVIAATNERLEQAISEGRFRHDLYYRLNVVPLTLPALRERRDDIPLLAQHFLERHCAKMGKHLRGFSAEAMDFLVARDWPGNVRELEHTIERAAIFCTKGEIKAADLGLPETGADHKVEESFQLAKAKVILQFESQRIQALLSAHQGNVSHAARTARKNRRAFWQLIRKHNINVDQFRPSPVISVAARRDIFVPPENSTCEAA